MITGEELVKIKRVARYRITAEKSSEERDFSRSGNFHGKPRKMGIPLDTAGGSVFLVQNKHRSGCGCAPAGRDQTVRSSRQPASSHLFTLKKFTYGLTERIIHHRSRTERCTADRENVVGRIRIDKQHIPGSHFRGGMYPRRGVCIQFARRRQGVEFDWRATHQHATLKRAGRCRNIGASKYRCYADRGSL